MSVVRPTGFNCWISFAPVVFTVGSLSSFYHPLIFHLYVLGDDTSAS